MKLLIVSFSLAFSVGNEIVKLVHILNLYGIQFMSWFHLSGVQDRVAWPLLFFVNYSQGLVLLQVYFLDMLKVELLSHIEVQCHEQVILFQILVSAFWDYTN